MVFIERNIFQRIRKCLFAHRENEKDWSLSIYGHIIRKICHCLTNLSFDDSGMFAPNNVIIQKNSFLFNVWKQS